MNPLATFIAATAIDVRDLSWHSMTSAPRGASSRGRYVGSVWIGNTLQKAWRFRRKSDARRFVNGYLDGLDGIPHVRGFVTGYRRRVWNRKSHWSGLAESVWINTWADHATA